MALAWIGMIKIWDKRICVSLVTVFLVAVLLVMMLGNSSADVPVMGKKNHDITYNLTNIKDHPDYIFLTSSVIWKWDYVAIINQTGIFEGGYKSDYFILNTVPTSKFNKTAFDDDPARYCANNTGIIQSRISLPVSTLIDNDIELDQMKVDLEIENISDELLNVSMKCVTYHFTNGTVESLQIDGEEMPQIV